MLNKKNIIFLALITLLLIGTSFISCGPSTYTLTILIVDLNGTEQTSWGSVSVSPSKDSYDPGELLQLTATENTGYGFVEWRTADDIKISSLNPSNYQMPEGNTTIKAVFNSIRTITVEIVDDSGTSQPTWGHTNLTDNTGTYPSGSSVYLEAFGDTVGSTDYGFIEWRDSSDNLITVSETYYLSMPDEDVTIKAVFGEARTLTIDVVDDSFVSQPTWGITTNIEGNQIDIAIGRTITLRALNNNGFGFIKWVDDSNSDLTTEDEYDFTMPSSDTTLKVVYELYEVPDFTLTNYDSTELSLKSSTFEDKYIMLTFSAIWCGWCSYQAGFMNDVYDDLEALGVTNFINIVILTENQYGGLAEVSDAQYYNTEYGHEYVFPDNNYSTKNAFNAFLVNYSYGSIAGYPTNLLLKPMGSSYEFAFVDSPTTVTAVGPFISYLQQEVPEMFPSTK